MCSSRSSCFSFSKMITQLSKQPSFWDGQTWRSYSALPDHDIRTSSSLRKQWEKAATREEVARSEKRVTVFTCYRPKSQSPPQKETAEGNRRRRGDKRQVEFRWSMLISPGRAHAYLRGTASKYRRTSENSAREESWNQCKTMSTCISNLSANASLQYVFDNSLSFCTNSCKRCGRRCNLRRQWCSSHRSRRQPQARILHRQRWSSDAWSSPACRSVGRASD